MSRTIIRLFLSSASAPVLLPKIKKESTKSHTSKFGFSQTSWRKHSLFLLDTRLLHGKSLRFFLAPLHDTFDLLQLNSIHLISTLYISLSSTLNLFNSIFLSLTPFSIFFLSSPNIVFDFQISYSTLRNRSNLANSNRTCKILRDSSRRLTLPQIKEREAAKAICCTVLCLLVLTALIKTSKNSFAL